MTDRHILLSMLVSLGLTLAAELAFALILGKKRHLRLLILANVMTNPPLVALSLVCKYRLPALFPFVLAGLEILACIAEGEVYIRYGEFKRPRLFSLCANALSFCAGLILTYLT